MTVHYWPTRCVARHRIRAQQQPFRTAMVSTMARVVAVRIRPRVRTAAGAAEEATTWPCRLPNCPTRVSIRFWAPTTVSRIRPAQRVVPTWSSYTTRIYKRTARLRPARRLRIIITIITCSRRPAPRLCRAIRRRRKRKRSDARRHSKSS